MTRIRFTEWLFAIVLVVAAHGLVLTGWAWLEPDAPGGVRLPAKTETITTTLQPTLPLTVTVAGEDATPMQDTAASRPAAAPAPATSSNEIIVVPTQPSVPTGAGQSTVVLAPPEISPPPPIESSLPAAESSSQASEGTATATLQVPPLGGAEQETQPSASSAGPSRPQGPVPIPKLRPGAEAPSEPPAADNAGASSPAVVATVEPGAPPAETETSTSTVPFSAAQSTYYRRLLAEVKKAQRYPEDAKREGKEGTVYLQIVVQRSGVIKSYDIIKSSGFQELDDAAVQTLVRANPVAPFPDEISEDELRFGLPMRFGS